MADINDLLIRIDATTEQLRRELKRAEQAVDAGANHIDRSARRIDMSFQRMQRAALRLAGPLAAVFSVEGIRRFTVEAINSLDNIAKRAQTANIAAETLQRLRFAFSELGGVAENETDMALQRFNRRLGLAVDGGGPAVKTFQKLGIALTDVAGNARATEAVLEETLQALAAIESQAERAAAASQVFGDEAGPRLAAALSKGIEAMNKAREAAIGVASDEVVAQAEALKDAYGRLAASIKGELDDAWVRMAFRIAEVTGLMNLLDESTRESVRTMRRIADLRDRIAFVESSIFYPNVLRERELKRLNEELEKAQRELRRIQHPPTPFPERRRQILARQAEARAREAEAAREATRSAMDEFFGRFGKMSVDQLKRARPRIELDEIFVSDDTELQRQALRLTERFKSELERAEEDVKLAEALFERGLISEETLKRTREQLELLSKDMNDSFRSFGLSMGRAIEDAFADAFMGIETNFGEMLRRMAIRAATSELFATLATFGGPVGKIAGFLGFGGGRAQGGEINPGRFYIVGERGPELIAPRSAGTVIPNHKLGGLTINVDARGAHDPVAVEQAVERGVRAAVQISGAQTQAMIGQLFRPAMA